MRYNAEKYKTIRGYCGAAPIYDQMIADAPNGVILVEIGTWMGQSAICAGEMILLSGKDVKLYTIDKHDGGKSMAQSDYAWLDENGGSSYIAAKQNFWATGVTDVVTALIADGRDPSLGDKFANDQIFGVYIDGDHDYASVKADISAWWQRIIPGGYLAGDDYDAAQFRGVVEAVNEFVRANSLSLTTIDRQWLVRKP